MVDVGGQQRPERERADEQDPGRGVLVVPAREALARAREAERGGQSRELRSDPPGAGEDREQQDLDDRTLHVRRGEGLERRDHGHRPASPPSAPTIVRVLASIEPT